MMKWQAYGLQFKEVDHIHVSSLQPPTDHQQHHTSVDAAAVARERQMTRDNNELGKFNLIGLRMGGCIRNMAP